MNERMSAAELHAMQEQPKGQKYGAQRVVLDDISFDSKREARRWASLRLLERAGKIGDLRRQVAIPLQGQSGPCLTRSGRQMRLTVDFVYRDLASGLDVYEDAKGMPTRDYEVRRAVAAAMGIEVIEV